MKARLLMVSTLCFIAVDAVGQEISVLSAEVHTFNSPMVLGYTLDQVFKDQVDAVRNRTSYSPTVVTDFRNYTCRGVTLERVTFELIRVEKEEARRLRIASELFNNSGKDKLVTISLALVKAGEVVATETLKGLRVQQGRFAQSGRGQPESPQEVTIHIPPNVDGQPYPKLRITVALEDY
jgi:hypothetical protein